LHSGGPNATSASISVLSNFAEGFEREGNTEFIQFLSVSKGSVGEPRGQLIYSLDLDLLEERPFGELDALGESATRRLDSISWQIGKARLQIRYQKTKGPRQEAH
jgi:four helix bundle protein